MDGDVLPLAVRLLILGVIIGGLSVFLAIVAVLLSSDHRRHRHLTLAERRRRAWGSGKESQR